MTRNKIYSKPTKKKPSEVIEFQENLFPFELLPRKMQNEIKKSNNPSLYLIFFLTFLDKRKRERADDDQFKDLLVSILLFQLFIFPLVYFQRKEKESGAYTEDAEEKVDEDRGSQSENDEDNENRQEDEERVFFSHSIQ